MGDLDPLGERAQVVAAVAAALEADALARGLGEGADHPRGDRPGPGAVEQRRGALGVGLGLVADRAQPFDPVLERGIVDNGDPRLDRIVKAFQARIRFGGAAVTRANAQAYVDGPIATAVRNLPDSSNHSVKIFDVRENVSAVTGAPIDHQMSRG